MAADYIYKPHEHVQSVPATEWLINHRLRRDVGVTVFDGAGVVIMANVEKIDNDNIKITFFRKGVAYAMAGRAVVT